MMNWILRKIFRLRKDESGAALLYVTITIPTIIALTSLAVDLGYVWYVKTRLQVAADMGALAGASKLYTDDETAVKSMATTYVGYNIPSSWKGGGTPTTSSDPKVRCLKTIEDMGLTCSSTSTGNALEVVVTATTPLFFANALGFKTITLSAKSLVSGGGASPPPLNVAIVLDATLSMASDLNAPCGILPDPKKIECASLAAKTLLTKLWSSVDSVALYTYPSFDANSKDVAACNKTGSLQMVNYMTLNVATQPNYQMFGFTDKYGNSGTPPTVGLDVNSDLVKALGRSKSSETADDETDCDGLNVDGLGIGTSIADAITQAQNDLKNENKRLDDLKLPMRQNVLIVLSDGDANGNTEYFSKSPNPFMDGTDAPGNANPGWVIDVDRQMDQCQSAVAAADAAAAAGTWVYSIAFGAESVKNKSCFADRAMTTPVINKGPFTKTTTNWACSSSTPCLNQASATRTISKITQASNSKQNVTITTGTSLTTCKLKNGKAAADGIKKDATCTTSMTPTEVKTFTIDLSKYDISACDTMRGIASDMSKFYSTDGDTACSSEANPNFTDLVDIFNNVAASIMKKRRIPNSTT